MTDGGLHWRETETALYFASPPAPLPRRTLGEGRTAAATHNTPGCSSDFGTFGTFPTVYTTDFAFCDGETTVPDGVLTACNLPDLLTLCEEDREVSILTSRQWPAKRRDILSRLESVLGEFPTATVPLEPQVVSQEDMGTYLLQKVRYQVEPDESCPAWLLLPKPLTHRQPAVLCCHQTVPPGKDEPAGVLAQRGGLALAKELVTRGYVCLAPDSITAGERVYPGAVPFDTAPFYARHPHWSALGKMLWDHQRALDFLCMLDAVDSDRLGVIGHSLGGENAIMLGAFDHRIKATAASCAYTPFAVDPTPERWCRASWFVYLPRLRGYVSEGRHPPFTWVEVLSLLAPRAFHYSYALGDECFPGGEAVAQDMTKLGRLYDLLGCRQKFANHQDPGEHRYPRPAREAAYRTLKAVLVEGRGS